MHLQALSYLPIIAVFLSTTQACMHYKATLPLSSTLPFEASISDNEVTVCWISTTYAEHKGLEMAVFQQRKNELKEKRGVEKRSNGHYVSLTKMEGLKVGDGEGEGQGQRRVGDGVKGFNMMDEDELKSRRKIFGQKKFSNPPKDDKEAGFLPWQFECLQGYKARANVGARTVTYIAHGQEYYFIPKEKEDLMNERWVYDLKLWCGKPGKNGLIAP